MRRRARWLGALLGLAVLAYPWLAPSDYLLRVGNVVLVYAILALGLNFTVGWTGQVSLGHAGFWGIGAYTTAILTAKLAAWSPWGAMALGATLAGLTGVLLGLPTLRIKGHYLALATIGFGEVVQLVFNNWRPVTGGADGVSGIPVLAIGPFAFDTERREFYLLLVAVALLTVGAARIRDSGFGRAFMAVRDNELAADVAGVPTTSVKTLAFALGAAYAGLAGSLYAHLLRYVSPDVFGFEQSLLILSMLVIGGLGSLAGALVGALVGVALPELLRIFGVYYMAVYALLVILVIVFMPTGLVGVARRGGPRKRPPRWLARVVPGLVR
ncbi:MAG: branched-chain amino acid ABC transporter permease [Candidatus Rokubacteria bacterium]|nr:branched-chain amino acid ABC transporter permease [Candidatus Rokubacteria bacterium]